jgi:hypothetical protein
MTRRCASTPRDRRSTPRRHESRVRPLKATVLGRYAKATAFAPATISSTTLAAPTMVTPAASCSSVMPRGFVQAPQTLAQADLGIAIGAGTDVAIRSRAE